MVPNDLFNCRRHQRIIAVGTGQAGSIKLGPDGSAVLFFGRRLFEPAPNPTGDRFAAPAMAEIEDNVDRELFRNIEKLRALRIEHRDLDEVIERLTMDIHTNELQLKRLKKRKLMLKDQITRMESQLIPDLNA
jgi:hypothetical protein